MGTKLYVYLLKFWPGRERWLWLRCWGSGFPGTGAGRAEPKSLSISEPEAEASPSPAEEQTPAAAAEKEPVPTLRQTPEPTPGLAETLETVPAGTIVAEAEIDRSNLGLYFQAYEISDRILRESTGTTGPINLLYGSQGRPAVCQGAALWLRRADPGGGTAGERASGGGHEGDFQILFEHQYQIEKMFLIDDYGADDNRSVNDNNTSCFNFRLVTNGGTLSNHAAGCAIDINPRQNPYYVILEDGTYTWENEDAQLYMGQGRAGRGGTAYDHPCGSLLSGFFHNMGTAGGGNWEILWTISILRRWYMRRKCRMPPWRNRRTVLQWQKR